MTRFFLLLAALFGVGTLASAAPRDWTMIARPAPNGSYVIGNPKAKVRLIEYVSYSCPHCRDFTRDSAPVLKAKMIRSGSTSLEIRNAVHDKLDLTAAILARCIGAAGFPRFHDMLFAQQEIWMVRGIDFDTANAARLEAYPQADRLRALADGAGLSEMARAAGMRAATLDRCFADPAVSAAVLRVAAASAQKISGTPAFEVNGQLVERGGWAKLEPILRAAGAK